MNADTCTQQEQGVLVIVSGPSGVGKGTLVAKVMESDPKTRFSVSATTRQPRPGEVDGESYLFITKEEFLRRRDSQEFLEWAEVYGNFYGTLGSQVDAALAQGLNIILDIDTQGADHIRELRPQAVSVFIMPPSLDELKRRILGRGTEAPAALSLRLSRAENEMSCASKYDRVIINDDLDQAALELAAFIRESRAAANFEKSC